MDEFFVGQRVVCICADPWHYAGYTQEAPICEGGVYTIRKLGHVEFNFGSRPMLGVWLEGIYRRSPLGEVADEPFGAIRFRPLESKPIELFRQIARDVTEGKRVEIEA